MTLYLCLPCGSLKHITGVEWNWFSQEMFLQSTVTLRRTGILREAGCFPGIVSALRLCSSVPRCSYFLCVLPVQEGNLWCHSYHRGTAATLSIIKPFNVWQTSSPKAENALDRLKGGNSGLRNCPLTEASQIWSLQLPQTLFLSKSLMHLLFSLCKKTSPLLLCRIK